MRVPAKWAVTAVLFGAACALQAAPADPASVSAVIDREVAKRLAETKVPASPLADDAEFLRRVYLDITGRIPTPEKAAAFLDSQDPNKRRKVIDELLADSHYGEHFGTIWVNLMVPREDNNTRGKAEMFSDWLADRFNKNRSWDRIVADILTAEDSPEKNPAVVFFLAQRDNGQPSPNRMVGNTSRLFLGVQLQCAECHIHPFIKQWKQDDFWGMAAFFSHVRDAGPVQNGNPSRQPSITETDGPKGSAGQKMLHPLPLPGAQIAIPDPLDSTRTVRVVKAKLFEGDEPALNEKGPYRPALASWLTSPRNKYFAASAVNRLWAHFFARGLVNPIEDLHDDNLPSHPAILQALTDEFKACDFDQKHLIRCICNSQAYQRTSRPLPGNADDKELLSHAAIKIMSPEVLLNSLGLATGLNTQFLGRSKGGGKQSSNVAFADFFDTKSDGDDDATLFTHGIPQFLRLMNSGQFNQNYPILGGIARGGMSREKVIEHLFLASLSRRPTADEVEKMSAYVQTKSDPRQGYGGVVWALINSAEFMFIR